ncbi:sn-glycerol-3-phosphate ABC transporter ATP-binding protein UgpC [Hanamia caeni]|jgi:multiple sugar transport system ATP-binding protein|uniref:sn-glycerol-3-phosphate ABC transporter ATP-binding protein UgpC n=1 Tax=Hanamia caeni TaxID=2294116 RepID=A0A3M9NGW2_9BACT|nr:sn-glycerol-3-phosphate ABC transporter ATP-binding protein UgpC [Hanamia caeni]RNI36198.1 sn-glycerol-3-phosphate ABC transporter ATP-binding protein UgpC [Hanamia caeni]
MAEVVLNHISKIYDDPKNKNSWVKAVDDISFEVHDNEFLVLVGPSGCGKSTLLRMIAGLEDITEGTLSIDGKIMNDVSPRDRDIAMVFQNYALYPHMTVYDNMAFGLKLKGMKKSEIRNRVMETASLLEIQNELDRKPRNLSGGQRQRVAIGRAIIRRPKVFLFDEPLSNLDAKLRSQMRIELQKLHRNIQATMIYVTHDQTEAMTLGNRIAVLNRGKLMQMDTPMNLYEHPANRFVGGFIGSPAMNFITGVLKDGENVFYLNDKPLLNIGNFIPKQIEKNPTNTITIGIRPENILVDTTTPDAADCKLKVSAFENMGNEQIIYLGLENQIIIARRPATTVVEIGQEVGIRFLKDKLFFMYSDTGQAIR